MIEGAGRKIYNSVRQNTKGVLMVKLFDEMPVLSSGKILLRPLEAADAADLASFTKDDRVYKYLPTFLAERQFEDPQDAITFINGKLFSDKESLILAVTEDGNFAGLAEFYGYKEAIRKTCVGYRLAHDCWGKGIATRSVGLMVDYLYGGTDIEIITASTMIENKASERVLAKNGFEMTARDVPEDWGYDEPTIADKWFR